MYTVMLLQNGRVSVCSCTQLMDGKPNHYPKTIYLTCFDSNCQILINFNVRLFIIESNWLYQVQQTNIPFFNSIVGYVRVG